jgi:hypothetical protein
MAEGPQRAISGVTGLLELFIYSVFSFYPMVL